MFLIGIINKDNLYFESKIKGTYYKKILTKENIYLLNEIFIKYKNIKDIYELIILSLNDSKIKIELMKNNKLKLTFSIKNEEKTPSPFEIILKSEENNDEEENDSVENESKKHKSHNNEFALLRDSNSESNNSDSSNNNNQNENENEQNVNENNNNNRRQKEILSEDESQDIVNNNVMSDNNRYKNIQENIGNESDDNNNNINDDDNDNNK